MTNTAEVIKFPEKEPEKEQEPLKVAQLENGYTRIANELLEAAMSHPMTLRQLRVLLGVIRKTYGFNKKSDVISGSQLAAITKLTRQKCSVALCDLVELKIINRSTSKSAVSVNKNISEWGVKLEKRQLPQDRFSEPKLGSDSEPVTGSNSEPKLGHTKDITKDIIKDLTLTNKFTNDDLKAAEYIFSKIIQLKPNFKKPNLNSWADQVRLLRERDKKTHREICELFRWANNDGFWQSNILSPKKLREKWDELEIKSKYIGPSKNNILDSDDTSWGDGLVLKK
jgi:phage replication O-like protein O